MITGMVLCGGESSRMGKDKALLQYHQLPQYLHVAFMLKPFCNQVVLSCNSKQTGLFSNYFEIIPDNIMYTNAGPLTGLLSVFEKYPNQPVLAVACDYPYLTSSDLELLLKNRSTKYYAVCFKNPVTGFIEPLIALYEPACFDKLRMAYTRNQTSLRVFLQEVGVKTILPASLKSIESVDYKK